MALDDKTNNDFNNVEKFRKEVIVPIFPNAKFASTSMWSSPDMPATSFKGKLSPINLFKGSAYEYTSGWKFLHFTSLLGLKAILETGFLRMSEFSNLIDNKEIHYGANVFEGAKINLDIQDEINNLKDNLFCLSLCESNEKTKKDGFMWEVYGDKGKGVFIEFEFTKPNPSLFVFGKVQYGDKKLKPIKDLRKLAEKYIEVNPNFFPNNFTELFVDLFSFHKEKRYKIENEVRMLMKKEKQQYKDHDFESIYKDINKSQEVKYFNKVFLKGRYPFLETKFPFSEEEDAVFNIFPQIEIKNIVLGYSLSVENKVDLMDLFCKIKKEYNYEYKISQINDEGDVFEMNPCCT